MERARRTNRISRTPRASGFTKRRSNEWRLKFKEAEAKVKTLEESGDVKRLTSDNRTLRLRLAFERALAGSGCQDVEAAWKLAEEGLSTVDIADDGTVDGSKVGTIVNHLLDKHPYFFAWPDEQEQEPNRDAFPVEDSGRPRGGQKRRGGPSAAAALYAKFLALRSEAGERPLLARRCRPPGPRS